MTQLGTKIKENRTRIGLTQKGLADKLFVTPQAVSRWENDGIEPPIDALKKMSVIFDISLDDLLDSDRKVVTKEEVNKVEEKKEEQPIVVQQPVVQQVVVQSYGICDRCHEPFKDKNDIHDIIHPGVHHNRHRSTPPTKERICSSCYEKDLKQAAEKKRLFIQAQATKARSRRKKAAFIAPLLAIIVGLILCWIVYSGSKQVTPTVLTAIFGSLYFYPFFACLFLNNNFIPYMVLSIFSAFFVKWPGIIFSFDLDGLKFLIAMKLLFGILGFLIGFAGLLIAVLLSSFISLFLVVPSFIKSVNNPSYTSTI